MDISVNSWSLDSCVQKEQVARHKRRKLQQQQQLVCPFSDQFSNSPCSICGDTLSTLTDPAQLDSACRLAIASYCTTRFEYDVEACTEFLSVYAECDYDSVLTDEERASLEIGVKQGRGGKGIIFVMSAGNSYKYGDSTNGAKWVNTRYTISVGAVGKDGLHASYSATGSSLFVSAPGGDLDHLSNNIVAKAGGGCHDIAAGTSFSAPVVAGVAALLLQANPELSWRDVQAILALTSQQVDTDDESWVTNAAGYNHSYKYGFGVVNAQAAVEAAKTWVPLAPEEFVAVQSELINLPIPEQEDAAPAESSLVLDLGGITVETETVAVLLSIDHPSRGDLDIRLTSPQGTESILHFHSRPENTHADRSAYWQLNSVRSWGEDPEGTWTLSLKDVKPGNLANDCVDIPWIYTVAASPDAPFGAKVTCSSIERSGTCADGAMINNDLTLLVNPDTQLTPDQACCICGGGMAPSEESRLLSWTVVIYGRTVKTGQEQTAPPEDGEASSGQEGGSGENGTGSTASDTLRVATYLSGICLCLLLSSIQ